MNLLLLLLLKVQRRARMMARELIHWLLMMIVMLMGGLIVMGGRDLMMAVDGMIGGRDRRQERRSKVWTMALGQRVVMATMRPRGSTRGRAGMRAVHAAKEIADIHPFVAAHIRVRVETWRGMVFAALVTSLRRAASRARGHDGELMERVGMGRHRLGVSRLIELRKCVRILSDARVVICQLRMVRSGVLVMRGDRVGRKRSRRRLGPRQSTRQGP
jgi:hypothetical protein